MKEFIQHILISIKNIPKSRIILLDNIVFHIRKELKNKNLVNLVYICTHNSRRSQFAQIWTEIAVNYFNINNIKSFSGGVEVTSFNPNAISALQRVGVKIEKLTNTDNPVYRFLLLNGKDSSDIFSKKYENPVNPKKDFFAIMTCDDAYESCPVVHGAKYKLGLTYEDPKKADNTVDENKVYDATCKEIASEMFYLISNAYKDV